MVRLNYYKRQRIISLYCNHALYGTSHKYSPLKKLAESENIFASEKTFRRIIFLWRESGLIDNKPSRSRAIKHTKITKTQLAALDHLIFEDRNMSLRRAKDILALEPSIQTIRKYVKLLGWRKIRTKYCQFVRTKIR